MTDEPEELSVEEAEDVSTAMVAQRLHLRRILVSFVVVVVLLPLSALEGALAWLLLPMLVAAVLGFRESLRLRTSVRRFGPLR